MVEFFINEMMFGDGTLSGNLFFKVDSASQVGLDALAVIGAKGISIIT